MRWWKKEQRYRAVLERAARAHAESSDPDGLDAARDFERRFRVADNAVGETARLIVGQAAGERDDYWVGIPVDDEPPRMLVSGSSGAGKSFELLALLIRLAGTPTILIDGKGEIAALVEEVLLPALATTDGGRRWIEHLRIIRPYGPRPPQFRLTRAADVPPHVMGELFANAIEDAIGVDLGSRMKHVGKRVGQFAAERDAPPAAILTWLRDPASFARLAQSSSDLGLRAYAATFCQESKLSLAALAARLDEAVFDPRTAAILSASGCVDIPDCFVQGLTIVRVADDAPLGLEGPVRFWHSLFVGRFLRAALARPLTPETPIAWVVADEWPQLVNASRDAALWGRALSLLRSRKIGLVLSCQALSQLDAQLIRTTRTNVTHELHFRPSPEDVSLVAGALPQHGDEAHRRALAAAIAHLPKREFVFWPRGQAAAQILRSPRLDLDELRARAAELPKDVRESVRTGILPVADLTPPTSEVTSQRSLLPALPSPSPPETDGDFLSIG